jgi:phospholipase/lecithinase/hemolysin
MGCTPKAIAESHQNSECVEELTALSSLHNRDLTNVLENLESKLQGFKYSIFDYYNELRDRVKNPSQYGRL